MNALLITFYGLIIILILSYVLSFYLKRIEKDYKKLGKLTAGKLENYSENDNIRNYLKLTNEF